MASVPEWIVRLVDELSNDNDGRRIQGHYDKAAGHALDAQAHDAAGHRRRAERARRKMDNEIARSVQLRGEQRHKRGLQ
ncbi:MAG: hypothetical protein AAGA93_00585 [Actinomycetota bacterium]